MKTTCIVLLALILVGCATPYQPYNPWGTGGYSQKQLSNDVYRVSFSGNGAASVETVQTYWLYRCSQLAIEKGYAGFEILSDIRLVMDVSPDKFFGEGNEFKKVSSYSAPMVVPTYMPPMPAIEADIRLLKNPITEMPPKVFDAAKLKDRLEPFVSGKKCGGENVCPHVHMYLFPEGKFDKPDSI